MSHTYKVVRHYPIGKPKTIAKGLSLEEAQRHCQRTNTHMIDKKTSGIVWFDGYTME
jgi:hypothetical protein